MRHSFSKNVELFSTLIINQHIIMISEDHVMLKYSDESHK